MLLTNINSCVIIFIVKPKHYFYLEVITMKSLNTFGKVLTKIFEVFHWIGAVGMTIAAIGIIIANSCVENFRTMVAADFVRDDLEVYGFRINSPVLNGELNVASFVIFCIGAALLFAVVAMIFRNLHLIFKKAENSTPFTKDNVRMMREIGILAIAIPVIGFILSIVMRLVSGVDYPEISIDMGGVSMGCIVLCFSQFFAHGVELENDVDGLL